MILYYITDRCAFPGTEAEKRERLLAKIAEAAQCAVDFIQLREKDLSGRELECLARKAVEIIRANGVAAPVGSMAVGSRLLINSRTDIALAVGADGVHLTSADIAPSDARALSATASRIASERASAVRDFLVAVSCHAVREVHLAESHGADFAVFAPVFEKSVVGAHASSPQRQTLAVRANEDGLNALRAACKSLAFPDNVEGVGTSTMPVLALGGVTPQNARACMGAGAAGIAGIRLFQDNDVNAVVRMLRSSQQQPR